MKHLFIFLLTLVCGLQSFGQDTTTTKADTVIAEDIPLMRESGEEVEVKEIDTYADEFVPRKASLYSAILPGLGQAYNKNYWKIPIIYGGFVALGMTIDFYNDQYKTLRADLFEKLETGETGGTTPLGFTVTQSRSLIDKARRERDFYMIMTGVLYLLQIAEAHIDAHLKEFKLNPDLKVSLEPMMERSQFANFNHAGLTLKFRF